MATPTATRGPWEAILSGMLVDNNIESPQTSVVEATLENVDLKEVVVPMVVVPILVPPIIFHW
jgi:hypothetical protein